MWVRYCVILDYAKARIDLFRISPEYEPESPEPLISGDLATATTKSTCSLLICCCKKGLHFGLLRKLSDIALFHLLRFCFIGNVERSIFRMKGQWNGLWNSISPASDSLVAESSIFLLDISNFVPHCIPSWSFLSFWCHVFNGQ